MSLTSVEREGNVGTQNKRADRVGTHSKPQTTPVRPRITMADGCDSVTDALDQSRNDSRTPTGGCRSGTASQNLKHGLCLQETDSASSASNKHGMVLR
mmetsp:Transcript_27774/g.52861  ORF Transcript_27774/g.52861 Transcript_27774/m.52861 type:complete len:98 (-) Transcript_27774:802-1095(-)